MENEGVTGQLFEGMEIYAKGIGLVYYEKKSIKRGCNGLSVCKGYEYERIRKKWENEIIIN